MGRVLAAFLFLCAAFSARAQDAQPAAPPPVAPTPKVGSFRVSFDPAVQPEPYSGRVYVVLARQTFPERSIMPVVSVNSSPGRAPVKSSRSKTSRC